MRGNAKNPEEKRKKRRIVKIRRKSKKRRERGTENEEILVQKGYGELRRKRSKTKNQGRRRFIVFWFLTICVAVIIGAFALLRTPFFSIAKIEYYGNQRLTEEQIIKISGVKLGENIFATNVGAAENRLENNPEIREAKIKRVFPNKLSISVTEEKILAYAEHERQFLLINGDGKIIKVLKEDVADAVKGFTRVEGLEIKAQKPGQMIAAADDARAGELFKCIRLLEQLQMAEKVNYINFSDLSDLKIEYENRLYILMGSYENLDYKLKFVKKVIEESISAYERALLDFRGEKLYVRPRDEEQPTPTEGDSAENKQENEAGATTEKPSQAGQGENPQQTEPKTETQQTKPEETAQQIGQGASSESNQPAAATTE